MKIIWSPEAADDFESAVTYLVGVNPAAARRLVASVLGLIEWLAVEPVLGPSHVLRNGDVVSRVAIETFSDLLPTRQRVVPSGSDLSPEARADHALTMVPRPRVRAQRNPQLSLYTAELQHKENRGIETFSIPRFSRCAGAQRGLYTAISLAFERQLVA